MLHSQHVCLEPPEAREAADAGLMGDPSYPH